VREQYLQALRFIRKQPERVSVFAICNAVEIKVWEIATLIDVLVSDGYIKQDGRDRNDPYSPHSTYYTVPSRRQEIDKLLENDLIENVIDLQGLDYRNAAADDRMLVCTNCWVGYPAEARYCRICCASTIELDTRIVDILYELNHKRYPTLNSCSGHENNRFQIYLMINIPGNKLPTDPIGFKRERDTTRTTLRSIPYEKFNGITSRKAKAAITMDELEAYSRQRIDDLRSWAKSLPDLNIKDIL